MKNILKQYQSKQMGHDGDINYRNNPKLIQMPQKNQEFEIIPL